MKSNRFWNFLQKYDEIWSIAGMFFLYWIVGVVLGALFGAAVGSYDLAFIQPLFLAVCIVMGAATASLWGLRFKFKRLWTFIYGRSEEDGIAKFNKLETWQQFAITLFLFSLLFWAVVKIFLTLV